MVLGSASLLSDGCRSGYPSLQSAISRGGHGLQLGRCEERPASGQVKLTKWSFQSGPGATRTGDLLLRRVLPSAVASWGPPASPASLDKILGNQGEQSRLTAPAAVRFSHILQS
jgi:hypothetical protein